MYFAEKLKANEDLNRRIMKMWRGTFACTHEKLDAFTLIESGSISGEHPGDYQIQPVTKTQIENPDNDNSKIDRVITIEHGRCQFWTASSRDCVCMKQCFWSFALLLLLIGGLFTWSICIGKHTDPEYGLACTITVVIGLFVLFTIIRWRLCVLKIICCLCR